MDVTPDQLMTTMSVLMLVFGAIVTIDKVVDIFKKWRAPSMDIAEKLATDKQRLDGHDIAIGHLSEGQKVLCSGVVALLEHELHNGNADQMSKASGDILEYLQGRMGT